MTSAARPAWRQVSPVYAAGFITAFGAHSVAANLGGYSHNPQTSLLTLGILLALYDGAEIVLKPVFGALVDRIGPRPVLLAGLIGFAAVSGGFALADDPTLLGLARLGQGAMAAAFSPAANTLVARLHPHPRRGRGFGSYGAWKGLGYTLGPLAGGVLITLGGYRLLFAGLEMLACVIAVACIVAVPAVAPLPRHRHTVVDLTRRLTSGEFTRPTAVLAAATAALSAGVGFLPALGVAHGLGPLLTGATVTLLATVSALVQPWAGARHDRARLSGRAGMTLGLGLAAAGFILAALLHPTLLGIAIGTVLIGAGTGMATPLGFAALAATDPARLGQTMGAAEVGRELGDAGGPLLVGAIATRAALTGGLLGLAALLVAIAAFIALARHQSTTDTPTTAH